MFDVEHLAHQGEAVGVQATGGQGQDYVPGLHPAAVNHLRLVHDTHGKARQVVVVRVHYAGVLGSLTADEGAAGLDAALRHAGYNGRHLFRVVFADGDVVQEEQGLGPAADNIVDAHGHAVDADGVMAIHQLGHPDLGAHAVGARHQDGLFHAGDVGGEQAAEAADAADHAGYAGALHVTLHQLDALVSRLDVYPGGGVGLGVGVVHCSAPFHSLHCSMRLPPSPCFSS